MKTVVVENLAILGQCAKREFNVFHMNIRSTAKNIEELIIFLSQLKQKFDILVLTETFVLENPNIFRIEVYNMVYDYGSFNAHDGVLLYIKDDINFEEQIIKLGGMNILEVDLKRNENKIKITAIYRSPASSEEIFFEYLNSYLSKVKLYDYHIITGDININLLQNVYD